MYGVYTYIYHKDQPNVGKYTIHGSYGVYIIWGIELISASWIYCNFFSTTNIQK